MACAKPLVLTSLLDEDGFDDFAAVALRRASGHGMTPPHQFVSWS